MKAFSDNVPSPCTGVCQMTADDGWCIGCMRTIGEIVDWARKTADEKRAILMRTQERAASRGSPLRGPDQRTT
ncbi:MAG: DUF1289 domain-containing protein [Planctomycetota bacterium]|nr:DUF1289 domain-containing protein [Planctomycetota bacterium]MDA0933572.1 DUF1289 domain-containing protein [Planctomycetota bacterium]MDA1220891.1 DUF1289 domain-containing protein [Planctomycetota bacterium]